MLAARAVSASEQLAPGAPASDAHVADQWSEAAPMSP